MSVTILDSYERLLFEAEEATTTKEAVEAAVSAKVDLPRVNLSGADLSMANLFGANLAKPPSVYQAYMSETTGGGMTMTASTTQTAPALSSEEFDYLVRTAIGYHRAHNDMHPYDYPLGILAVVLELATVDDMREMGSQCVDFVSDALDSRGWRG